MAVLKLCCVIVLVVSIANAKRLLKSTSAISIRPSAVFGFTDSLSDTGNRGIEQEDSPSNLLPYGYTLGLQTGRYCDGYLTIDHLVKLLKLGVNIPPSLLHSDQSYFRSLNFGYAGATVLLVNNTVASPHILKSQVQDFIAYQNLVIQDNPAHAQSFQDALYYIEIGGDDINFGFTETLNELVNITIPTVVQGLRESILTLYAAGARNFLVFGMPAAGCAPVYLAELATMGVQLDNYGCVSGINAIVETFNLQIHNMLLDLGSKHDGNFIFFDWFAKNMDLIANAANYGFVNTVGACCGSGGGAYNCANATVLCGCNTDKTVCADPDTYMSWDGIHQTQQFYFLTADAIMKGNNMDPPVHFIRH